MRILSPYIYGNCENLLRAFRRKDCTSMKGSLLPFVLFISFLYCSLFSKRMSIEKHFSRLFGEFLIYIVYIFFLNPQSLEDLNHGKDLVAEMRRKVIGSFIYINILLTNECVWCKLIFLYDITNWRSSTYRKSKSLFRVDKFRILFVTHRDILT